ncbi:MAG: ABC transporter permease [Chloroflexi bacterium]|nr:ABC transporter permease [Chloroflexota bacterium]
MTVADLDIKAQALRTTKEESQFLVVWRRFRKHKLALLGMIIIGLLVSVAVLAPVIAPHDPLQVLMKERNLGPTPQHWLGTDELGRDVLSRLMFAARISLLVGFSVTILGEALGVFIGAIAGYFGGWVDSILTRFLDFMTTLPGLPLLMVLGKVLADVSIPFVSRDYSSVVILVLILTLTGWMGPARLVRGMVLSLKSQDFTEACRALGVSDWRIIMRHMIPNAMAPIIVSATLGVGGNIVVESGLSFLGFGVQLPTPTWGNMLQNVQADMWVAPWKAFYPGLAIFLTSLSFNFMGDGLRDALDPRLKM